MNSYSETNVFTVKELFLLKKAKALVGKVPEYLIIDNDPVNTAIGIRCHELVRAVASVLKLDYVDGKYQKTKDHSWILIPGKYEESKDILDVYCIGSLPMVQLKEGHFYIKDYTEDSIYRKDINERIVAELIKYMNR